MHLYHFPSVLLSYCYRIIRVECGHEGISRLPVARFLHTALRGLRMFMEIKFAAGEECN